VFGTFARSKNGLNFGDFLHYIRKTPKEFGELPFDDAVFLLEWYNQTMTVKQKILEGI
jgi:hypothetical protein